MLKEICLHLRNIIEKGEKKSLNSVSISTSGIKLSSKMGLNQNELISPKSKEPSVSRGGGDGGGAGDW